MDSVLFKSVFVISVGIGIIQQYRKNVQSVYSQRAYYFGYALRLYKELLQKAEQNEYHRYFKVIYKGIGVCLFESSILIQLISPAFSSFSGTASSIIISAFSREILLITVKEPVSITYTE